MLGVLCAAAGLLLVVSGTAKVRVPLPTVDMLVALVPATRRRRPALRAFARLVGVLEIAAGVLLVVTGTRVAAAVVALLYLAFAVVAARLALAREATSCGCFGRADAPVGVLHVALDLAALAVTLAAVVAPVGRWDGLAAVDATQSLVRSLQAVLVTWLAYLTITALPALSAARARVEAR